MLRLLRTAVIVLATACGVCVPARAQDSALLTIGAGVWDINFNYDRELEGRLEYRFGHGLFESESFRGLKPLVGIMATSAESLFGYAGFAAPFSLGDGRWELAPSAGLGAYEPGDGLDLGGTFEFHLGLSITYPVTDDSRLGLYVTHISNAGINDDNPGVNSLLLTWSFAL